MGTFQTPVSSRDLFSVEGKAVVVTGGTSGIGRMIADGFVRAGAEVIIASRKTESVDRVVSELSPYGNCSGVTADLSSEQGSRDFAEAVANDHGKIHVLVNNAGATWGAPLSEHDTSSWNRVLNLNVQGVFESARVSCRLGCL